jgi:hypothetical protein
MATAKVFLNKIRNEPDNSFFEEWIEKKTFLYIF